MFLPANICGFENPSSFFASISRLLISGTAALNASGNSTAFTRAGDSGGTATFHFCPTCGSTVYWQLASAPDLIAVAVGNFADPRFPKPRHSVYEERRHSWVNIDDDGSIEHLD